MAALREPWTSARDTANSGWPLLEQAWIKIPRPHSAPSHSGSLLAKPTQNSEDMLAVIQVSLLGHRAVWRSGIWIWKSKQKTSSISIPGWKSSTSTAPEQKLAWCVWGTSKQPWTFTAHGCLSSADGRTARVSEAAACLYGWKYPVLPEDVSTARWVCLLQGPER